MAGAMTETEVQGLGGCMATSHTSIILLVSVAYFQASSFDVERRWSVSLHLHFLEFAPSDPTDTLPKMSRWVVVDDTSNEISYDGTWMVTDSLEIDGTSASSGPPLYNTLHGTYSEGGIVFDFQGSSFVVIGSQFNSSSIPQWTCFIDDVEIAPSGTGAVGNNLQLCSKTVADGTHRVVLNISATDNDPFWFDNFLYLPSAGMELDQADVVFGWDDSVVQCDPGWEPMKDRTMTNTTGSKMSFNFNGASLIWIGAYNHNHTGGPANATYSVDGESPISFILNNTSTNDVPLLANQQFFQTSEYPPGDHRLEVIYGGDSDSTPLTLERLIVQNSTISTPLVGSKFTTISTTLVTATSTPTPTQTSTGNKMDSRMIASVIGGAIGGFLFLALVIIIFVLLRRCSHRRHRRKGHPEDNFRDVIEPYTHNPLLLRPSNYDPLPTSSRSKRPMQLGIPGSSSGPLTPSPRDSRRSIMRNLLDSLGSATFGTSRRNSSLTNLLPSTSSSSYSHTRNSSSWVVVHEDSGVRLLPQGQEVVEIPPTYSAR